METYILLVGYVLLMLITFYSTKKNKIQYLIITCIFLFLSNTGLYLDRLTPKLHASEPNKYEISASYLMNYVSEKSKVYIVSQNTYGEYQYFTKYYANPITVNVLDFNWPLENPDEYYNNIKNELLNYDYIYFASVDDDFINKYGKFFNNDVSFNKIFKIINNNGTIEYEKVN